jgi:hypothetical protein
VSSFRTYVRGSPGRMIVQRTTETLASLVGGRDYDCTSLIDCDLAVLETAGKSPVTKAHLRQRVWLLQNDRRIGRYFDR